MSFCCWVVSYFYFVSIINEGKIVFRRNVVGGMDLFFFFFSLRGIRFRESFFSGSYWEIDFLVVGKIFFLLILGVS